MARIDHIVEVERATFEEYGYAPPSRFAVVAKLLELGADAWEQGRRAAPAWENKQAKDAAGKPARPS